MATNPLLALLGQSSTGGIQMPGLITGYGGGTFDIDGTQVTPARAAEVPVGDEITVTAPNTVVENPVYSLLPREDGVAQIQQAPADTSMMPRTEASPQELAGTQNYSNLPEHKGLFGVKGTLRNVLGTLGDALAGNQNFGNQRQKEKLSDAMIGFNSSDPTTVQAAIERVARVNPQAAQALAQQYQTRINQMAERDLQGRRVDAELAKSQQAQLVKGRELAANILNMVRQKGDLSLLPAAIAQAERLTGIPAAQLGLSPQMSLDDVGLYAYSGIKGAQQENIDLGRDRLQQQRELAELAERGRMARDHPPQGRATPQPTEASILSGIMAKPEGQRTKDEQDFLNNKVGRNKKGSLLSKYGLGGDTSAPKKRPVIRNGKLVTE